MNQKYKTKIFVAGSDTNVGKTYITNNLLKYIVSHDYTVMPFKPVETGCKKIKNKLIPNDSKKFFLTLNKTINLDDINPYRFVEPISPNKAMILSKRRVFIKNYIEKVNDLEKKDFLIVEGAGGLLSPISRDGLNIDLIKSLHAKVILVIEDKVGAINHTLLNLESLKKRGIELICIILNRKLKVIPKGMDNLNELKTYTKTQIFQTYNKQIRTNKKIFQELLNLILR